MIEIILSIIVLILAIPTGYLIAHLTKDELKQGRSWFRVLIILSIVVGFGAYLFGNNVVALTCAFIFIISLISFIQSSKKK